MDLDVILLVNILKQAYIRRMPICIVPATRLCIDILYILVKLNKIKVVQLPYTRKGRRVCKIAIYYNSVGYSLMHNLQLVSTRTRLKSVGTKELYERYPLYSTLVSTPHGIFLACHALRLGVGGIVVCTWYD